MSRKVGRKIFLLTGERTSEKVYKLDEDTRMMLIKCMTDVNLDGWQGSRMIPLVKTALVGMNNSLKLIV